MTATANGPYASYPSVATFSVAAPGTTNFSTTVFVMVGLGGLLTPAVSGNARLDIYATLTDSATTVGEGIILQAYMRAVQNGVAVPVNGGGIPAGAVPLGAPIEWASGVTLTTAADSFIPISFSVLALGLTVGQQYWFDLAAKSVIGAGVVALTNVNVLLQEVT